MHLAAAAEELSGKACRIDLMKAHYDQLRERVVRALSSMPIEFTVSQLKDAIYGPKNSIKHMDSRNDAEVSLDPESETAHFIVAAHHNFATLGLSESLSSNVRAVVEANALHVQTDA